MSSIKTRLEKLEAHKPPKSGFYRTKEEYFRILFDEPYREVTIEELESMMTPDTLAEYKRETQSK